MSIDGKGDINVFFSSSRVGFGEPLPPTSTTSLLTFADLVLALDHKNARETAVFDTSNVYGGKTDHTYASSGIIRTTRSQTAKATVQHQQPSSKEDEQSKRESVSQMKLKYNEHQLYSESSSTGQTLSRNLYSDKEPVHLKNKRCSSVENILLPTSSQTHISAAKVAPINILNKTSEWHALSRSSPRKSCSFEEVSLDSKSIIKTSKSTENVQKTGVSHTLHRLVNDTLEFPCWPRKADHTYATATWDGTAASHSLFEKEIHEETTKQNLIEDHEMEEVTNEYLLPTVTEQPITEAPLQDFNSFHVSGLNQKDHTYVKPKTLFPCHSEAFDDTSTSSSELTEKHQYSSATFPRQKMREDHTYFHSGLSRKVSGSVGGREWSSAQTVTNQLAVPDLPIEETYRSLHSFTQRISTKKDHNYSSST
ncbi:uncharacterized protein LOC131938919 [Physella acuta]|uniref:uncharacterized protein LOC131938919 n=1 Tax=Physella acuta TaxID=109671 RepID=UPI0027DAE20E|nr:uncharacterized protein LOC131938919 [Physella acuta]